MPTSLKTTPAVARFSIHWMLVSAVALCTIWQLTSVSSPWSGKSRQDRSLEASAVQIDLNVASQEELSLIPSVGNVLAKRIIDDRDQNGAFVTVHQVGRVRGVGEKNTAAN